MQSVIAKGNALLAQMALSFSRERVFRNAQRVISETSHHRGKAVLVVLAALVQLVQLSFRNVQLEQIQFAIPFPRR